MTRHLALSILLLTSLAAAVAFQVRSSQHSAPASLATYVPQDALLTIESTNFSRLLQQWQSSGESKAWLASANYSVFQNSRLFGRLNDAQNRFAQTAGIPVGAPFLDQVAGDQSVFAWYDIGNLEFLYITHMPSSQAQAELLNVKARFERRRAGALDFYVRTTGNPARTVAFAQVPSPSGDLLLLATREDLIANALNLIAGKGDSITRAPWFSEASSALPPENAAPALHMVLNLDRIVPLPAFRTYWIQRNITWMKQYRAAVSDLYLEASDFREERALLPRSPEPVAANLPDLTSLSALPPPETGIYRAVATRDPALAATAIEETILGRNTTRASPSGSAPDPILDAPQAGSASDLETRINEPAPVSPAASTQALIQTIQSSGLEAMLTLSSAQSSDGLWIPIHSAVVLEATHSWEPQAVEAGLQQSLRGSLTTSTLGIDFKPLNSACPGIYALTGPRPLFFATRNHLLLLSDDLSLLILLLQRSQSVGQTTQPHGATPQPGVSLVAAFNQTTQRAPYLRLTSLIDGTNHPPAPGQTHAAPAFFSGNVASLTNTFSGLEGEKLIQYTAADNLRQTITYSWREH